MRGRCSPSPFLQSQNSSLWTARLMPCGPMIVLATRKNTTDSKTYQHAASCKASPSLSGAQNNQIITGFCHCLPLPLSPSLTRSLSSAPHSNIQTNKICRLLNGTAVEPSHDLDVKKLQRTQTVIKNYQRNIQRNY